MDFRPSAEKPALRRANGLPFIPGYSLKLEQNEFCDAISYCAARIPADAVVFRQFSRTASAYFGLALSSAARLIACPISLACSVNARIWFCTYSLWSRMISATSLVASSFCA